MSSEELSELFEKALTLPPNKRAAYLESACKNRPDLRSKLEKLLDAYERAENEGHFMTGPAIQEASTDTLPTIAFEPGQQVAERYRIVRFLGEGGMGQVYEAKDEILDRIVALKTIRPEIASDKSTIERFKKEVKLAHEVAHQNVCRVFDLEHRNQPPFLTMEFIDGETLASWLRNRGRLAAAEAMLLVEQMAAGLQAAHQNGVVHGDFKPGNVMLNRSGKLPCVKITDFGLARSPEGESSFNTTHPAGTPVYMAPEQILGGKPTTATDVYALGLVMYELVTGARPVFDRLSEPAPSPRSLVQEIDPKWETTIRQCLERDPTQRLNRPLDVVAALTGAPVTLDRARRKLAVVSMLVMLTLGLGFAARIYLVVGFENFDSIVHPLPEKRFVALMEWPAAANSQYGSILKNVMATTGNQLSRAEASNKDLLIISSTDVTTQAPPKTPGDAVAALGANLVLAAEAHSWRDGVALSLKVMDAATQRILRETQLTASAVELGGLPERAAIASAKLLGVSQGRHDPVKDRDELAGVGSAAYVLFTAGEDLLDQPNNTGIDPAIEKYQKTLDLAPEFALAYARLSNAYVRKFMLTQDGAVLMLAQRNADLAMKYNPDSVQALLSQALVDSNSGRAQQALDEFGKALQIDPRNPQILFAKARTLRDLDRRTEEEGVYRSIVKDRPNYWPAYNELGLELYRRGDYQKAAEAFAEGSAVAPKVSMLYTNQGTMNLLLGKKTEAETAFLRSLEQGPNEIADQNLGAIAFAAGNYRKALDYYSKARDLRPSRDTTWRNIADCYRMLGDAQREKENYAKAAELLSDALRINPNPGASWMNLAFYQAKLGEREEAGKSLREAASHGASDLQSEFKEAQILALVGKKEEALRQVLDCLSKGLALAETELAVDLKEVRNDPRYKRQVALIKSKN